MSDLLSQEEIDALLNGVDEGQVETESDIRARSSNTISPSRTASYAAGCRRWK